MPEYSGPDHPVPHPDLGGYVLGALEPAEAEAFATHLETCPECRAEYESLAALPDLLARAAPAITEPPGLRDRTLAAVAAAATGPDARATRPERRRRSATRLVTALAAVAALFAGLLVATTVLQPAPAGATVVLVSPTGARAHGIAHVRTIHGIRTVDMRLSDMPATDRASYYECWFVGAGDDLAHPNRVSVGTFRVGTSGSVHIRMTTAADAARFPTMGVTLEPDDGNPARTGVKVLVSR